MNCRGESRRLVEVANFTVNFRGDSLKLVEVVDFTGELKW